MDKNGAPQGVGDLTKLRYSVLGVEKLKRIGVSNQKLDN